METSYDSLYIYRVILKTFYWPLVRIIHIFSWSLMGYLGERVGAQTPSIKTLCFTHWSSPLLQLCKLGKQDTRFSFNSELQTRNSLHILFQVQRLLLYFCVVLSSVELWLHRSSWWRGKDRLRDGLWSLSFWSALSCEHCLTTRSV